MTKYPPKPGYNCLLDTGAVVYTICKVYKSKRWSGINRLNPEHPTTHYFTAEEVVFSAPADIWDGALFLFRQEQLKKQEELRRR